MPHPNKSVQNCVETSLPFNLTAEIKAGEVLAGDDFVGVKLTRWFEQEKEAFFECDAGKGMSDPWYAYMRYLNERLGFSLINEWGLKPRSMLVVGPGSGLEIDRFAKDNAECALFFLESSARFKAELVQKYPLSSSVNAVPSGDIDLEGSSQDIVCAFSVLHHIPNVSHVIHEIYRVLTSGGIFLVREPCSSMGDWRFSRTATPNERGISRSCLMQYAKSCGFDVLSSPKPICFAPLNILSKKLGVDSAIPLRLYYWIDRLFSWGASLNDFYWRDTWFKKLGPSAYFYVFRKA